MKWLMLLLCGAMVLAMPVKAAGQAGNVVPIPVLSVARFDGKYEPTCLGNGFVGFRPGINPLVPVPVAVAGFYRTHGQFGCVSLCPAPYSLAVEVKMDGQVATLHTKKQSLDLSCGELTTELEAATANGKNAVVKVVQFASRSVPCVVAQEISLLPAQDGPIELSGQVAMSGAPVEVYRNGAYYDGNMWDQALGVRSDRCKLGIAVVSGGEGVRRISPGKFDAQGSRGKSLRFWGLAKYHLKESIEAGVILAKTQGGHGSQKQAGEIMKEIVSYGTVAREARPGLKELIVFFNDQCNAGGFPKGPLNQTRLAFVEQAILAIEAAQDQPELRSIVPVQPKSRSNN